MTGPRPRKGDDVQATIADAYAALLDELVDPAYTEADRAMLSDAGFYYGRFIDPQTRPYALHAVQVNLPRATRYFGLPADRPPRILDLGCGPGMQSLILARLGAEVIGLDLDPRCIALANKRQASFERRWITQLRVRFIAGGFHDFARSWAGEPFDAVFSMSAFAHIAPMEETVGRVAGVLGRDGRVFLWDQNPEYLFLERVRPAVAHLPRPGMIARELVRHDFRVELCSGGASIPRHVWRVPQADRLLPVADRLLRRSLRLSFSYVIAARRGGES